MAIRARRTAVARPLGIAASGGRVRERRPAEENACGLREAIKTIEPIRSGSGVCRPQYAEKLFLIGEACAEIPVRVHPEFDDGGLAPAEALTQRGVAAVLQPLLEFIAAERYPLVIDFGGATLSRNATVLDAGCGSGPEPCVMTDVAGSPAFAASRPHHVCAAVARVSRAIS